METIGYGQDEGSISTKEGIERLLKEENIVFNGNGIYALKILPRYGENPLIQMYSEDDESLYETNEKFDVYWIDDLIDVLNKTKEEVQRRGLVVYTGRR